jgi:hypothetical protein
MRAEPISLDNPFSSFSVELLEIDASTGGWAETRAVPAACFCVCIYGSILVVDTLFSIKERETDD